MRRVFWFLPALFLLCVPAHAQTSEAKVLPASKSASQPMAQNHASEHGQTIPEWSLYGGFSYLRADVNRNGSSFGMNGGSFAISENINSWFGGRFQFNAWDGTLSGTNITAQDFTYGPVFSYRKFHAARLFGDLQFGGMHVSRGYLGVSESDLKFAMSGGGGLDFKFNRRAAIRVQAEYLMSNFLNMRQDNLQVTTGLVIYLGRKKKSTW